MRTLLRAAAGFAKGKDSNHRLTTDRAVYRQMLDKGWVDGSAGTS